jgi:hypothetical protein
LVVELSGKEGEAWLALVADSRDIVTATAVERAELTLVDRGHEVTLRALLATGTFILIHATLDVTGDAS